MTNTKRVLFTRGLSSVAPAVQGIQVQMHPGEFELHASYHRAPSAITSYADHGYVEPTNVYGRAYLDWLLKLCEWQHIDCVWPQSHIRSLLRLREQLPASIQWLLPVPDLDIYELLADKERFHRYLAEHEPEIAQPEYRLVYTVEELDQAYDELRERHAQLCIKPNRGIYGAGYRLINEQTNAFDRWLANDVYQIRYDELRERIAANQQGVAFLLMEFLPGAERSMDCLVEHGQLRLCVTRRKSTEREQFIDPDPASQQLAARLCQRLGLHGVINIQTRERLLPDGQYQSCLLEINPRMSGGVDMCRAAGVNLPLLALRMLYGTLGPLPEPRWGLHVTLAEYGLALVR